MKVKHDLLGLEKDLNSEVETSAYIRGLLDELYLYKTFLSHYIAVAALHTSPEVFATIRLSFEGVFVEWILTGKRMEKIWRKRNEKYKKILKDMGAIPEDIEVS